MARRTAHGHPEQRPPAGSLIVGRDCPAGRDEGIVAEGKQVDEVLDLTDGTGAGVIVDFQTESTTSTRPGSAATAGKAMLRCNSV